MGYLPVYGGGGVSAGNSASAATSKGVLMVTSGVANTKGAYTALIAATTYMATLARVVLHQPSAISTDYLIDVAVGAGGSEVILFPDLHLSACAVVGGASSFWLPCSIPAGTRLSARQASNSTSAVCNVTIELYPGGLHGLRGDSLVAMNVNAAASCGTLITLPGANNTKGAYLALTASSTKRFRGLIVHFGKQQAVATQFRLADIAIGAGGSEQVIIPNIIFNQDTTQDEIHPWTYGPFPVDIPAGTRIAMRYQQDVTGAGRDVFAIVYGIV